MKRRARAADEKRNSSRDQTTLSHKRPAGPQVSRISDSPARPAAEQPVRKQAFGKQPDHPTGGGRLSKLGRKRGRTGNETGKRLSAGKASPGRRRMVKQPLAGQAGAKKPVSAERLMAIERRKARSRAVGLSIFVLLIMLVTMLLIISVMQQAKPRPRFMFLTEGQIDQVVRAEGLILRDETVFTAPADGLFKPLATENSRSAKDQRLALIIPQEREAQLAELQKTERDLVELQIELMNSGKGAGARAIYDESAASLETVINLIRSDAGKGDLSNLSGYTATINVMMEQRTAKLMTVDFRDARIDELNNRRNQLESSLGLEAGLLTAERAGIVSYKTDGLEENLNNELAETLTAAEFETYLEQAGQMTEAGEQVSAGQPVMRITSSLQQHLVFLLPDTEPRMLSEENDYTIQIPAEGMVIEQAALRRTEAAGDHTLAVFETDRMIERLSDRRKLQAEIVITSTQGLRIPLSALIEIDDYRREATLVVVSGGYTRAVRVAIIDRDREYAIIEGLPDQDITPDLATVVVLNPDAIEVGEFIGN